MGNGEMIRVAEIIFAPARCGDGGKACPESTFEEMNIVPNLALTIQTLRERHPHHRLL